MKALKKILTLVLAVSMVLTMGIGMGVNAEDAPTSNTYDVNTDTVKLLGRHFESGDYTCFSYGAAGVEIKFSGTDLWVDIAQLDGANESTAVMVLVDTLMPMEATKYIIAGNAGWLQVAYNLEEGEHTVRIIKMSRGIGAGGWFGTDWFGVRAIAVNEGGTVLEPNAYSDLVIEAYGDSITNGDAVWKNADGSSNSYTYGAYSGVVSRLLGAELQATGNTGNGLNSWVLGAGNLFPPRESWSEEDPRASQHNYPDHSDTDVVIINLGTNDMIAISSDAEDCAEYTEEAFMNTYIEWMTKIHEDTPDAIVIGTLGAMGADILFDDIQAACAAVNEAAGVEYAFFTPLVRCNSFTGGLGHDNGHPSNYAHEVYGLQLAKLINEKLDLGMEEELNNYVPYDTEYDYDNLAVLATAYDAGYGAYNGTAIAANANDANITTDWQYASGVGVFNKDTKELFDCWLAFEFSEATTISEMQITWEGDTRAAQGGYTVQYSDDGETWTDIADAEYVYGVDSRPEDIVTFEAVTAKYFRINMTVGTSGKDYCPKIYEVVMYGESSQTPGKPNPNPGSDPTPAGKGDVNGDGNINSTDYTQVRRHFLGTFTIAEEHLDAADVDSDGQINGTDFMRIRRHFLGTYTIEN